MAFDTQELAHLKARCHQAQTLGFHIARADWYVSELAAEVGDVEDVAKDSPAHLLALIEKAEAKRGTGKDPKHAEKSVEKAGEKHAEKSVEMAVEKHAEKHAEKTAEKHVEKAGTVVSVTEVTVASATVEAPSVEDSAHDRATVPSDPPKAKKK